MRLNRRLTGALAWGGLLLILGVPSAEIISAKVEGPVTPEPASTPDPVETASTVPAKADVVAPEAAPDAVETAAVAPSGPTGDPVDGYLQSGKPLPDYISGGADTPATRVIPATGMPALAANPEIKPVPAPSTEMAAVPPATAPAATPPTVQTASLPQPAVAPVPMPASMRPAPQVAVVQPDPVVIVDRPGVATNDAPVILDENAVLAREATTRPVPPAPIPDAPYVSEEALDGWDSGTLADYLARHDLLSDASYGRNRPQEEFQEDFDSYDSDGFFLDQGPNQDNGRYRREPAFIIFPAD